jgi:hypothetical protein
MVAHASSQSNDRRDAFTVAAPQAGDMLSGTLRDAFRNAASLPDDMAALLARLDDSSVERR